MLDLDRRQQMVFIVMAGVILLLTGILIVRQYTYSPAPVVISDKTEDVSKEGLSLPDLGENDGQDTKIKVYITGQVKHPGVIEVPQGSRLVDVIELAGGPLPEADLQRVNLAIRVQDEGMYVIPKIGEEITTQTPGLQTAGNNGKVNINTADQKLLETLPGIGPVRAKKIIEYREKNGPFTSIEDIKNVPGIGEKTFESLKDAISVK